jgi:hypothetical protein
MYVEATFLNLLVNLVPVDDNTLEFDAVFALPICSYSYNLLVVTPEISHLVRFPRQSIEQVTPLSYL